MIEKMKKIIVVSPYDKKALMLEGIRDLGVVHISEKAAPDASLADRLTQLSNVKTMLKEMPKVEQKSPISGVAFDELHAKIVKTIDKKRSLSDEIVSMKVLKESLAIWGDFDPSQIKSLEKQGIALSFYKLEDSEIKAFDEGITYILLKSLGKQSIIAVVGQGLSEQYASSMLTLPEKGISQLSVAIEANEAEIKSCDEYLNSCACYISSYDKEIVKTTDSIIYTGISEAATCEENLILLQGFIPEVDLDTFRAAAKKNGWAFALDDPTDEDPVPTKIRYNKVTRMMQPLFDMLGTVPGYREYDISMYFMLFLSLFFAMIIGDAAYGVMFLIVGIVLNVKTKTVSNINLLLYVMSIATIVWGALTGTWFGSEAIMNVPFFRAMVIPSIANYPQYFGVDSTTAQNTVMKFCFAVGAIQLSLACIMNIIRKWKQRSLGFVADFAWLCSIISIYFLSLMLVIGESVNVMLIFLVVGIDFVLIVLFGAQEPGVSFGKGVKAGLGGAFTTFLNTISAFGNVMSYIRLFAVGMASLAIAQSFNGMASSMLKGFALPAGMLILFIGHGLNIIMGMLSVIVHGVRLNLLEFSGQLGMEWAGIPYEPFKKNA